MADCCACLFPASRGFQGLAFANSPGSAVGDSTCDDVCVKLCGVGGGAVRGNGEFISDIVQRSALAGGTCDDAVDKLGGGGFGPGV